MYEHFPTLTWRQPLIPPQAGLLLLRGLQALGASACVSIAYGVIADVCVQSERGGMVGPVMSATNVGTFLGPVLGGLIAWKSGGHEWVFWAMFIFGCTNFVLLAACLPETSRTVVGNGLHRPASKSLWHLLVYGPRWQKPVANDNSETDRVERKSNELEEAETGAVSSAQPQIQPGRRRLTLANPLTCLRIMFAKDTALILLCGGVNYAVWYAISAMIPSVYRVRYGWNELEVGLAYLPGAAGVIIAGIVNGKWMDYKYRRTAGEDGFTVDKVKGDNLDAFHIERARCRDLFYIWAPYNASVIGLGWAIETQAHAAVSLVLQAMIGALGTFLFFCFNTLLVDVHPEQPSTAAAAATVFRCGLAAIGVAILQPLLVAMGYGWYLTMVAILVGGVQGMGLWAIQKWGWKWRKLRVNKMNRP